MLNTTITTLNDVTLLVPTRDQVETLQVGDLAIDCFGEMRRVTGIFARGYDTNGRAYVCYYTEHGEGSSISHSMKEGQLVRTVATSRHYTSAELVVIERRMRRAGAFDGIAAMTIGANWTDAR